MSDDKHTLLFEIWDGTNCGWVCEVEMSFAQVKQLIDLLRQCPASVESIKIIDDMLETYKTKQRL